MDQARTHFLRVGPLTVWHWCTNNPRIDGSIGWPGFAREPLAEIVLHSIRRSKTDGALSPDVAERISMAMPRRILHECIGIRRMRRVSVSTVRLVTEHLWKANHPYHRESRGFRS